MARALSRDTKLIIMDEPSAVLDSEEVKNLFRVVDELTEQGIAVVYISHRLEEIRQIGDRITVIKDGASMASGLAVADTPTPELIRLMTGPHGRARLPAPSTRSPPMRPSLLDVEGLALRGVFADVDFTVRAGEVVGLAGLVGSGRSEILETVYGARKATAGTVRVDGRSCARVRCAHAVNAGIGLSPEERKSQGLLLEEPVYKNVTLATFARFARVSVLDERRERAVAREQIEALELRPADPDRTTGNLSGGNQQKILLARWLVQGTARAAARRAHPRRRRRRPLRDLRAHPPSRRRRDRHRRGLERDRGGARPRRPRARDRRGPRVLDHHRQRQHRRARRARPRHERNGRVSEQTTTTPCTVRAGRDPSPNVFRRFLAGSAGRNLGLVIALVLIVIVGAITGGERFTQLRATS